MDLSSKKMYNYCTLFNSSYLTRGLAMYESLKYHSQSFHLYIFAFDDRCYQLLKKLDLSSATVISLHDFEDDELLSVKDSRSVGEYCWTCTASTIKYAIETYKLTHCTYLDADLYFFANPSPLIEEMETNSVSIIEHRYTPEYDKTLTSGKYCVQFMTFKNNSHGMNVLNWWRDACIEWCYARSEDGKCGDQKYLDNWGAEFEGVCELKNLGGGVAPWNIQQYHFFNKDNKLLGIELATQKQFSVIFYHFHSFKFLEYNQIELASFYKLSKNCIDTIYKPYIIHLNNIKYFIENVDSEYDYHGTEKRVKTWKDNLKTLKRFLVGRQNIVNQKDFV